MRRAVKVTLKYATDSKKRKIKALLESYRSAVNFYIRSLWHTRGHLDSQTLARLPSTKTRLSERYKSQALKQALETVVATKKSAKALGKKCRMPIFRGSATLDAKFVSIEDGKHSFDLILRLSMLKKGSRITIPTRKTAMLGKWLSRPSANLIQGCSLSEDGIAIWVELPDLAVKSGESLGLDIGVNKLLSDSNGNHYGTEFKQIRDKIARRKKGSKGKARAIKHRDNFIRQQVNKLPWQSMGMVAIEDLKNLKKGKKKNRNKQFRKAMVPWTYRRAIQGIQQKCQENRVHLVKVSPKYTSQSCPACAKVSQNNRKAEKFKCIQCGYSQDADSVGAMNILKKAFLLVGSVESPMLLKGVA